MHLWRTIMHSIDQGGQLTFKGAKNYLTISIMINIFIDNDKLKNMLFYYLRTPATVYLCTKIFPNPNNWQRDGYFPSMRIIQNLVNKVDTK